MHTHVYVVRILQKCEYFPVDHINVLAGSLVSMANVWQRFVTQKGGELFGLISTRYEVMCPITNPNSVVGKRATCQVNY